jgi:DNA-directed RNA polymerase subunit RPC12/RpoP
LDKLRSPLRSKKIFGIYEGGKVKNFPEEYICSMCGFTFCSSDSKNIFCPECGSSVVTKEISIDEFLEDENLEYFFKDYDLTHTL